MLNTPPGTHTAPGDIPDDPLSRPLQIYTLGRFSLVHKGRPLSGGRRKSPYRPLQLLKALIASGGRQVSIHRLAGILWPEQDGDRAMQAFDTTLHRLRRLIQDDGYLPLIDGHLSLDSQRVWVDVWEFERCLTALQHALGHHKTAEHQATIDERGARILHLYQGHFLQQDDSSTCWSVSLQERLRSRLIHTLLQLGSYREQRDQPEHAIACYRKGIETDDLIETFYQRLIVCYGKIGREPEAIATYRQCCHVLAVVLGLQPTAETRKLYQGILARYRLQAS